MVTKELKHRLSFRRESANAFALHAPVLQFKLLLDLDALGDWLGEMEVHGATFLFVFVCVDAILLDAKDVDGESRTIRFLHKHYPLLC